MAEALRSYADYLEKAQDCKAINCTSSNQEEIREQIQLSIPAISGDALKPCYRSVNDFMINKELYAPLALDNIYHNFGIPDELRER